MKHLTEPLQQSQDTLTGWGAGGKHLQYHISQCCAQEHTVTYSPQHPGLGSQGLSASFELQRAISATHRRHQVLAAVSPARSGKGRSQAEIQYLPFQIQQLLPFTQGWTEVRIPLTKPTRFCHQCSDLGLGWKIESKAKQMLKRTRMLR